MVSLSTVIDQYVAPALRLVIGGLAVLGAAFMLWMSARRRAASMALKALGGLLAGALLTLWGLAVIPGLFWLPLGHYLIGLSLALVVLGVLVDWARSRAQKHRPGTSRDRLFSFGAQVLVGTGIVLVWLVAPARYRSGAVLAAALLFVLVCSLVRRRRARPHVSESAQSETQRKPDGQA